MSSEEIEPYELGYIYICLLSLFLHCKTKAYRHGATILGNICTAAETFPWCLTEVTTEFILSTFQNSRCALSAETCADLCGCVVRLDQVIQVILWSYWDHDVACVHWNCFAQLLLTKTFDVNLKVLSAIQWGRGRHRFNQRWRWFVMTWIFTVITMPTCREWMLLFCFIYSNKARSPFLFFIKWREMHEQLCSVFIVMFPATLFKAVATSR